MGLPLLVAFSILLFCSILPHSILVSSTIGSIVVILGYVIFGVFTALHWHNRRGILRSLIEGIRAVPLTCLVCLFVVTALYTFHVALGNYSTITNAISGLIIPLLVLFSFVYIPRVISPESFLRVLAGIAVVLVSLGGIIHVAVTIRVAPETLLWPYQMNVPIIGSEIYPLMSLTNNPNTLAQILFAGTIASFVLSVRTDRRAYGVFTGICAVGLLATGSRASVLSAVVALAIYIVYTRGGQTYLRATLGLLAITIVSVLILLPSLNQFGIHVTFTGRVQLWTATMHAIAERPIVGYGLGDASEMINTFVDDPALQEFGPHNSYLRMTLHLGIFGGLSYLVLTGWVFLRHVTAKRIDVPFVAIGAGFAINQLFEDNMMFEPTIVSIVMTVVFGYLVADHLHLRRTYRQEHRNRRPIMRCDDSDTGLNTNGSMSSRSSSRTLVRPDPTSARYVAKPKPKRRTNRRSRRRYGRRVRRER